MDLLAKKLEELTYRARDVTFEVLIKAFGGLGTEAISLRDVIQKYVINSHVV